MVSPAGFDWTFGAPARSSQEGTWRATGLQPGACFGGYRVDGVLGQGAMGTVLRAFDLALHRPVALKLLQGTRDEARLRRFQREGALSATLDHPGVVRVHAGGVSADGRPFLVMELVEGARELADVIREVDRPTRLGLLVQVARAAGYAHRHGVVHRDLKPGNVLVDAHGRAHVCDFGLAWTDDAERLTRTGAMVGTPSWMAPEQLGLGPRQDPTPAADVWSLGVILYQCLTGELPFPHTRLLELSAAIAGAAPVPPRQRDRTVHPALEAVCLRALAKDPAERFPDGEAFAAALEQAILARPRRHGLLLVLAGLGAAGLLLAVAIGSRPPRPAIAVAPPPTPAPAPSASAPVPGERPVPADPEGELRAAAERPLAERAAALEGWLARYPDRPERPRAASLLGETRRAAVERAASWRLPVLPLGKVVLHVQWIDDERVVICPEGLGSFLVWTTSTPRPVERVLPPREVPRGVLPGGREVLSADPEGRLRSYSLEGEPRASAQLESASPASAMAVSPDGTWLAIGQRDGRLSLVPGSLEQAPRTLLLAEGPIRCLAFREPSLLFVGIGLGSERGIGNPARALALEVPSGRRIDALSLHRASRTVAARASSSRVIWGLQSGEAAALLWSEGRFGPPLFLGADPEAQGEVLRGAAAHRGDVDLIEWGATCVLTASVDRAAGAEPVVKAWDGETGRPLWQLELPGLVAGLAAHGQRLALAWLDGDRVRLEVRRLE